MRSFAAAGWLLWGAMQAQAQTPPPYLFHWTNSRRFPAYQATLDQNRLPLRAAAARAGDGAEYFFAAHTDAANRSVFFMWEDVVGGMGAGSVEFYAKLDQERNVKPRLIAVASNPRANVRTVKTILTDASGLEGGPSAQSFDGVDLVLHEVWQRQPNGQLDLLLKEWIVLTDQAYSRVLSHLPELLPFVSEGVQRLTSRQPIDSHAPGYYDFNTNGEARRRGLQALLYVQSGMIVSAADCAESLGQVLRQRR